MAPACCGTRHYGEASTTDGAAGYCEPNSAGSQVVSTGT